MTLTAGSRLGPYEILSPIGAGGMGEVYKARDTRLERTVAIKVLPQHLSSSPEVRQRFEREAKTISQLSHPHICALYDVGREGEIEYLVMEYLEGESLSDRLARGALALEQTLRNGIEIAGALDKAHRQGIVHRDLKPGNVMLTKAGVKLLDFGLAKVVLPAGVPQLTSLPTQASPVTQAGTVLGTFQYMAPEQLEGKEADARSDIFALGAVLYEMATGVKAFSGATQASLIGAILHTEPLAVSTVQPMSPPALDRVVQTCLAKDPEERWQSAQDIAREIKWIAGGGSQTGAPVQLGSRRKARGPLAALVAAFVLGAAAVGLALWFRSARRPVPASPRATWLSMVLPVDAPIASYGAQRLALSPDGSYLAYPAEHDGVTRLYLRSFDRLDATPIRDSDGATSAFFSPDSRWLGFASGARLMKVPVQGGVPQTICEASEVRGASWGTDGTIVFSTGTSGLHRVPASGGASRQVLATDPKHGDVAFYWPEILPGNDAVLFSNFAGRPRISILSLKTGKRSELIEGDAPQYSPSGHILFCRGSSLFAAPFDLGRLELTGPAISILDGMVLVLSPYRSPMFAVSAGGTLAYAPGSLPGHTLVLVDRQGKEESLATEPHEYEEPRFSPDGKRLAVTIRADNPDIWVLDVSRGTSARLTFDPGEDETPVWTPDGSRIAFSADRSHSPRAIYWRPADGSGAEDVLAVGQAHPHVTSWSPDGKTLVFTEFDPVFSGDIWTLTLGEKSSKKPWLRTPFNERAGRLSPDGRWMAYMSNESGRDEVYVQPFPGPGGKWQISVSGGTEPVWAHSGNEIFYRSGETMMAVQVHRETSFSAESPRVLFRGHFVPTRRGDASFDISPDDKRFVMIRRDEKSLVRQVDVILNFADELKRRASATSRP